MPFFTGNPGARVCLTTLPLPYILVLMPRLSIMKMASLAPMSLTSGTALLLYCFSLIIRMLRLPACSVLPHIGLPLA